MSSLLQLSAVLTGAAVRRTRKSDGALFAIARAQDRDRHERRDWTIFVNDLALIEVFEEMRVGEPIAVTGPFSFTIDPTGQDPEIAYRISAHAILGGKRKRKSKKAIRAEERIASDEADGAPKDDGRPFDDAIEF